VNTKDCRPANFYLHPWEIDPGQPRLPTTIRTAFRQYTGLERTKRKLDRLLSDFSFAPICEVFQVGALENSKPQALSVCA